MQASDLVTAMPSETDGSRALAKAACLQGQYPLLEAIPGTLPR